MVYINNLQKDILPLYVPPEEDELFTSWLCRLSLNHGIKPHTFLKSYLNKDVTFFSRDYDRAPLDDDLITFLENHTLLSRKNILDLFLIRYNGYAFNKVESNVGFSDNILSLGIKHRDRSRFGLQVCPKCLSNSKLPYYKTQWRLVTSICCVKCNELLIDKCPKCFSPIAFHRLFISNNSSVMNFNELSLCFNCKFNFKTFLNKNIPNTSQIKYQTFIDSTIKLGYNKYANYSFLFLEVLMIISQLLISKRKLNKFSSMINKYYIVPKLSTKEVFINFLELNQRSSLLPFVLEIIENEELFDRMLISEKFTISYFNGDKYNSLGYWWQKKFIY